MRKAKSLGAVTVFSPSRCVFCSSRGEASFPVCSRLSSLRRPGVCACPPRRAGRGGPSRGVCSWRFLPGRPLQAAPDSCGSHDPELSGTWDGRSDGEGSGQGCRGTPPTGARGVPTPSHRGLQAAGCGRPPSSDPRCVKGRVTCGTEHAAVNHGLSRGKYSSDPVQTRCSWMLPPPAGLAAFCDILQKYSRECCEIKSKRNQAAPRKWLPGCSAFVLPLPAKATGERTLHNPKTPTVTTGLRHGLNLQMFLFSKF